MFGQLKSIVDILRSGLSYLDKRKKEDQHVELVLRLLETYFILKDCADEGEALLKEAGPDPAEILRALDAWKAHSTLKKWDAMVRRQGIRLRMLLGYISGQESLSIVDPDLQERIKTVNSIENLTRRMLNENGISVEVGSIRTYGIGTPAQVT